MHRIPTSQSLSRPRPASQRPAGPKRIAAARVPVYQAYARHVATGVANAAGRQRPSAGRWPCQVGGRRRGCCGGPLLVGLNTEQHSVRRLRIRGREYVALLDSRRGQRARAISVFWSSRPLAVGLLGHELCGGRLSRVMCCDRYVRGAAVARALGSTASFTLVPPPLGYTMDLLTRPPQFCNFASAVSAKCC